MVPRVLRQAPGDATLSIPQRWRDREEYLRRHEAKGTTLVRECYILAEDAAMLLAARVASLTATEGVAGPWESRR